MQSHDLVGDGLSIHFYEDDPAGAGMGILDRDAIKGVLVAVTQSKVGPIFRDDRVDRELVTAALEAQNFLEPDAIRPSRRACVPSPAAASAMVGKRETVARHDVRFDLVPFAILVFPGTLDGIQHSQKSHRLVAISPAGESHGNPGGGMSVLAAVFPHTWRITFDITNVGGGFVERWSEEQDQLVGFTNEMFLDRPQRDLDTMGVAGAGNRGPGLRERIDAGFEIFA